MTSLSSGKKRKNSAEPKANLIASSPEKRIIEAAVQPEHAGKRLDQYLADRFTYRSRTQWQEAVAKNEILLNGKSVRSSRILQTGEILAFVPEESSLQEPQVDKNYTLLLQRKDFFAVSKPPAIPVHPSGRFFANTLLKVVEKDFGKVYLVNRLDRETSGVTLFAKDPETAKKLCQLFEQHKVQKKYLLIVHGRLPSSPFTVSGFLTQDEKSPVQKKRRFIPDEKTFALLRSLGISPCKESELTRKKGKEYEEAVTSFFPVKCTEKMSIAEVLPSTGRLHQIRATACSLKFPVAGDKLYGLEDTFFLKYTKDLLTEEDKKRLLLSHQALHAKSVEFTLPGEKESLYVEAPLPEEFSNLYQKIMCAIL